MRTFFSEMKKSISEALDKRRQKLLMQGGSKQRQEDNEVVEIDTSTHVVEPDELEVKLERQISQEDNEKLERDIEQITHKIVEKSEFMLKLAVPEAWRPQSEGAPALKEDSDPA